MNAISTQFPELPTPAAVLERTWRATWFVGESKLDHDIEQHAVYTADQMHQYARDYAAMLAAAPAASGAHPDALPDGTLSKSTAKRVDALASASVSERARALMAQAYRDGGYPRAAGTLEAGVIDSVDSCALSAIEQALTQQRGESSRPGMSYWAVQMPGKMPKLYGAYAFAELNWYPDEGGALVRLQEVERIGEPTTPQPSADAVRELVKRWRACAKSAANGPMFDGASEYAVAGTYIACADELESLLSGGSHA